MQVARPTPKEGLYKLTAAIHSPADYRANVCEMFGFAESTLVKMTNAVAEPTSRTAVGLRANCCSNP